MDNSKRGPHSHTGASAKTGLVVSDTESNHQNFLIKTGSFLERVAKSFLVFY
jgi:hypothetical protein